MKVIAGGITADMPVGRQEDILKPKMEQKQTNLEHRFQYNLDWVSSLSWDELRTELT